MLKALTTRTLINSAKTSLLTKHQPITGRQLNIARYLSVTRTLSTTVPNPQAEE